MELVFDAEDFRATVGFAAEFAPHTGGAYDPSVVLRPTPVGPIVEAAGPGLAVRAATGAADIDAPVRIDAHAVAVISDMLRNVESDTDVVLQADGTGCTVDALGITLDATPMRGPLIDLDDAFPAMRLTDHAVAIDRDPLRSLLWAASHRPSGDSGQATVLFSITPERLELGFRWTDARVVQGSAPCVSTGTFSGATHPFRLFDALTHFEPGPVRIELSAHGDRPWLISQGRYTVSMGAAPIGMEIERERFEEVVRPFFAVDDAGFGPDDEGDYLLRVMDVGPLYARLAGSDPFGTDAEPPRLSWRLHSLERMESWHDRASTRRSSGTARSGWCGSGVKRVA